MRTAIGVCLAVAAAALLTAWLSAAGDDGKSASALPAEQNGSRADTGTANSSSDLANKNVDQDKAASNSMPYSAAGLSAREQQLALAQARYERAKQSYDSYREATRYPHESRPISEHPDQLRPFDPITEEKTLRDSNGKALKGLKLRTTQSMVFMSGNDVVSFAIQAVDERGAPLPLLVTRAVASNIVESKTPVTLTQVAVPFAPDASLGESVYSARFAPATQGFAKLNGTIRLLAQVSVNGEQGVAHFDVIYAPAVPATWAGVREAMESGSLNFYLKAKVAEPGRYVVSARVDDAEGKPFALLQFNDEVGTGEREFKLNLFGVLVRDLAPKFPLQLRDVQGFVLYPDRFPDRAMMSRQKGTVHVSGSYPLDKFSQDEWTSEERERYLKEYKADLERALQERERLSGG